MLAGLLGSGISRSAHSGFLGAIRSSFPIHINRTAHLSMPKASFTSAHSASSWDGNRPFSEPQLSRRHGVTIKTLARRYAVSPLGSPSPWSRVFQEFHCPSCGGQEAYRSRTRGFFEKGFLPLLMLRPVRCERCYHRRYIFRTVPVLERVAPTSRIENQSASDSSTGTRVA